MFLSAVSLLSWALMDLEKHPSSARCLFCLVKHGQVFVAFAFRKILQTLIRRFPLRLPDGSTRRTCTRIRWERSTKSLHFSFRADSTKNLGIGARQEIYMSSLILLMPKVKSRTSL